MFVGCISENSEENFMKIMIYRLSRLLRRCGRALPSIIFGIAIMYLFCEYLIYYVVQNQCTWPLNYHHTEGKSAVRALIIADTHLLGPRRGHWVDKWRREWQMQRAFQTALQLHKPELVFVLGDLFDEGQTVSDRGFSDYVERFYQIFKLPHGTQMYTAVGNHDVGFHYSMSPHLAERFEEQLNAPPVQLISIRGNHFVLLNSMALEGDGCMLCAHALQELDKVSNLLKCTRGSSVCRGRERLSEYSRPILMQHFPLYRSSDLECSEADAPPLERAHTMAQRWDCVSRESTETLVEMLQPRAAFGGHTHHACTRTHRVGSKPYNLSFTEYSVASFSHRNRANPEYMLAVFTPRTFATVRCRLPTERALLSSAAILLAVTLVYSLAPVRRLLAQSIRTLRDRRYSQVAR